MRIILICLIALTSACSILPERRITTETITVQVPVLYSIEPPVLTRPDLAIHELSEGTREDFAFIVRSYKTSISQLLGYIETLEAALDNYGVISDTLDANNLFISDGIEIVEQ